LRFPRISKPRGLVGLAIALATWAALAPCGHAANEAAVLELWKEHLAAPNNHEGIQKACQTFLASNRSDPLVPVVQGIAIWHLLQAGQQEAARRLMEAQLAAPAGAVEDGARLLAKGWLTRLDREKTVAALQLYYRKEVAYPTSLEALASHPGIPAASRPPATDRFDKPWSYRVVGFGTLAGFSNQKYALQSPDLGELSDFRTALQAPYGSSILAAPVQILSLDPANVAVKFADSRNGGAILLSVGTAANGLHLAFVGTQLVAVCNATHWKIFPKP